MGFWGQSTIRRGIALLVAAAFCGIGSARAEMHTVVAFEDLDRRAVLMLAEGESQGTRLGTVILADSKATAGTDSAGIPSRLVVVFDKQTWPIFQAMWKNLSGSYADPSGTRVTINKADTSFEVPHHDLDSRFPLPRTIVISVADKNRNFGRVYLSAADMTHRRHIEDAIGKISDYLNQPAQ